MKAVVIFLVAILIVGGIKPFLQAIGVLEDTVIGFSPLLYTGINEYVSTPYFITGGIMAIASIAGVVIGRKQGQVIYYIVSVISAVMGLASFSIPFFQYETLWNRFSQCNMGSSLWRITFRQI